MTGMGALNLKVDAKTKEKIRNELGETNPENHRRRTISLVLDNVGENVVQGLIDGNRRGAPRQPRGRGGRFRQPALRVNNYDQLPSGRFLCRLCNRDYARSSINR